MLLIDSYASGKHWPCSDQTIIISQGKFRFPFSDSLLRECVSPFISPSGHILHHWILGGCTSYSCYHCTKNGQNAFHSVIVFLIVLKWSCIIKSHPGSRLCDITKVAKDFTMQKKRSNLTAAPLKKKFFVILKPNLIRLLCDVLLPQFSLWSFPQGMPPHSCIASFCFR